MKFHVTISTMSTKLDRESAIRAIQELAEELKRTPRKLEFEGSVKGGSGALRRLFGENYGNLLSAAGLSRDEGIAGLTNRISLEPGQEEKLFKKYKQLCAKTEKIQGFFRHTLDLDEMFRRAGNPEVLRMAGIPDTHVKFRDVPAVNCAKKILKWYNPDVFLIFGDFVDCEGISHWPTGSLEPRRLVPEMKEARMLLQELQDVTPNSFTRIYLEGNHENWIEQGMTQMPQLFEGLEDLDLEINLKKLLALDKFKYDLFPMNHLVQIGNAHFTHGIFAGNNHAKKHLDTFKTNIYYGHVHDRTVYRQTGITGSLEASSQGCLCRLDAAFLKGKPNNWDHGLGIWEYFKDGSFVHYWVPIYNGLSSFAGTVFDGNKP